jgi:DNA topoisomerase-3
MLAKKTPALIAIDEAHCISHWGHDFRPEYRMLGERLPLLRPAPVVALTATATPAVQDDIVELLGLGTGTKKAQRFIHGFRRENLALEVVDCAPTQRRALAAKAVADAANRPAILYAPTRKEAEEIAEEFADEGLSCAAYHAGLPPKQRESVQNAFLKGGLEVVVATIAFGMGVDKADVRTVVHLALPSSLEAYSQEVGRAGRDGKPSRALLLGSLVDTKMHAFFLDRDYPESKVLGRVWRALPAGGRHQEDGDEDDVAEGEDVIRKRCGLDDDTFSKAIEKLWIHGGATGVGDKWVRGHDRWENPYLAQKRHKETQIGGMSRFLDDKGCRQLALLRHFGDTDGKGPCGICDACAPEACRLRQSRAVTDEEAKLVRAIEARLRTVGQRGISTGKLYSESLEKNGVDRRSFEHLLSALVRAGRVAVEERMFDNERGERIRYQNVTLTSQPEGDLSLFVSARDDASGGKKATTRRGRTSTAGGRSGERGGRGAAKGAGASHRGRGNDDDVSAAAASALLAKLKAWRLQEAQARKAPAFTIAGDRLLLAIAAAQPTTLEELERIPGVGPKLVQRYGRTLIGIVDDDDGAC